MHYRSGAAAFLMACAGMFATNSAVAKPRGAGLPTPQLVFRGSDTYEANGFDFVRYQYDVANKASYPKALFATMADLPACGENAEASRTAVTIYDKAGKKITEFCSLPGPEYLGSLWFAVAKDKSPPSGVYIEITDRSTGKKSRSKVAPTAK